MLPRERGILIQRRNRCESFSYRLQRETSNDDLTFFVFFQQLCEELFPVTHILITTFVGSFNEMDVVEEQIMRR
ncbi:hypothetical protein [Haladaptatus sp. NG-SE-30]